jgi:hypothetical protein
MAKLSGQQDDLTSVVTLMSDEVRQDMPDVQGQVAPDVGLRRWHLSAVGQSEVEKRLDASAAAPESREQFTPRHLAPIDQGRRHNTVLLSQSPDPPAPGIVKVRRHHPNRASWRSRKRSTPQFVWKVFDQVRRDLAIGAPRREQCRPEIRGSHHGMSLPSSALLPNDSRWCFG